MTLTHKLAFDISQRPPTMAELNLARRTETGRQFLKIAAFLVSTLGLVLLLLQGSPASIDATTLWGSRSAVMFMLVMAVIANSFEATVVAMGLSALILLWSEVSVALTVLTLTPAIIASVLANSLRWGSRSDTFNPIDAEKTADACIALDRCAQEDATVRSYLLQVSAMGRAPVIGEYRAAKAWVANQAARDAHRVVREAELAKIAQARAVCAAWASPPNTGTEIQDEATKT